MDACDICECHECTSAEPAPRGLLSSPWFYFGGIASLAFWSFLYLVVSWAAR